MSNSGRIEFFDVFTGGREGFHTYRIPSVICTRSGRLIAFAEGRKARADLSENRIVMKIGEDGGRSWSEIRVLLESGRDSYANPCAVVTQTGRIILNVQFYPYPTKEKTAKPGLEGPYTVKNYILYSDDEGNSWHGPIDITRSTKRTGNVTTIASGPGIGITLTRGTFKGRIIIPYNQGPWGKWKNYVTYSDDNGLDWKMGNTTPGRGNETQAVELDNGDIMLNSRNFIGGIFGMFKRKYRLVTVSKDGGLTWSAPVPDKTLIEPNCQASILRYSFADEGKSRILFCNPASKVRRINGTVRVSYDNGKTWKFSRTIYPGNFAYSCLVKTADRKIGCLFETGKSHAYEKLVFALFDMDYITGGKTE